MSWQKDARCVDAYDPEIFFDPHRYGEALAFCKECPVVLACRAFGKGQGPGVWGGRVQYEQSRNGNGEVLRVHGTEAGYNRHRLRGETPCQTCVSAAAQARAARKRRRRAS